MTELDPDAQHHPALVAHKDRRRADTQLRIADAITEAERTTSGENS